MGLPLTWVDLDVDVLRRIPELVTAMELPFGDPAAVTLMQLSRAACGEATVLLSGLGVEELFLGYERYQAVLLLQRLPAWARPASAPPPWFPDPGATGAVPTSSGGCSSSAPATGHGRLRRTTRAGVGGAVAVRRAGGGHRAASRGGGRRVGRGRDALSALAECDRRLFLPGLNLLYGDRASMRASVELRVPFLGSRWWPLPSAPSRRSSCGSATAGARAAAVASGVPEFVARRPKTGFGAPVRSRCASTVTVCGPRYGAPRCSTTSSTGGPPTASWPNTSGAGATGGSPCSGCSARPWWELNAVGGAGRTADVLSATRRPSSAERPGWRVPAARQDGVEGGQGVQQGAALHRGDSTGTCCAGAAGPVSAPRPG
ncbi:asparagine synthase C-terminal domain-containing protein [Streptomyces mirabilis]|nr:asparagine synthase C-terminal domain-containing protein [Streptomyces mirabilis]